MILTDTTALRIAAPRSLTLAEFLAEGEALFGPDKRTWAFQCPTCGAIATGADFPRGQGHLAAVECLGRHGIEGRCKRVAYGLFPGPWMVGDPEGMPVASFPFAAPSPTPITARLMGPADAVRYEVAKCNACGEPVSVHGHDGLAVGYVTDLGVRCGPCVSKPAPSQAPQSAQGEPQATPGPESALDAPDAAVGPRCGLSVERGTPRIRRTTLPDGYAMPDPENWDYRVALGEHQSVLGYRDIDGVPVALLFADTSEVAVNGHDWGHPLAPDMGAAKEHIENYRLPITETDLTHAVLLIVEACAEDNATHVPAPSEPYLTGDDHAESES